MHITTSITIDIETGRVLEHEFYEYDGPVEEAKASQQEKDAANASTKLSNQISTNMNTSFANSQQIQGGLNTQLQRLTNAGLAGQGFMPGEEAALRSQSKQDAAQQNVTAEQALNQRLATSPQTSGAVAAGNERLATAAAAGDAKNQLGITAQNAALARENVTSGLNGLGSLAGTETNQATGLGGTAVNANENSFKNETQAYQPSTFWSGLGTSIAGMGLNAIAPRVGSLATGLFKPKPVGNPDDEQYQVG
jgi:hypothetical protein